MVHEHVNVMKDKRNRGCKIEGYKDMGDVIYTFNVYWTDKMKIDFLQRVILIHSYAYYQLDRTKWTDRKYDKVSKQLVRLQSQYNREWIKEKTQYGYVFYDFDGTTGFDLWDRLNSQDKIFISNLSVRMVQGR